MIYTGKGGKKYTLESSPFAQGGEGKIFKVIGNAGIVAKLYKDGLNTVDKERKLLIMVDKKPSDSIKEQIAWPIDVLYNSNHKFVGFIMPKLAINEDLNVIYEFGDSAKYPNIPWSYKIVIAKNLCAVLSSVHSAGHVVGDLNPKNISVDPNNGHIIFVDTDSYHIEDNGQVYRCNVGMPEYLPVEIQRKMKAKPLSEVALPTFSKNSDNFALAIHIFQLLMNGTHPFACRVLPSQDSVVCPQPLDNIINGVFPFMQQQTGMTIPLFAPPITILPQEMQQLFKRAFIEGHSNPTQRPTPEEWYKALSNLEKKLTTSCKFSYHEYYNGLKACPWCQANERFKNGIVQSASIVQSTYKPIPKPVPQKPTTSNSSNNYQRTTQTTTKKYSSTSTASKSSGDDKFAWLKLLIFMPPVGILFLLWMAFQTSIGKKIIITVLSLGVAVGVGFLIYNVSCNTKNSTYTISTASDLELLSKHSKATFELANDIDMNGATIDDFGSFSGVLNGYNHKIYNFKLKTNNAAGLFTEIKEGGRVENLLICDFEYSVNDKMGGIAYYNHGEIVRCGLINGDIVGGGCASGIVGKNYGTISECFIENVEIVARSSDSTMYLGGICGENYKTISDCYSQTTLKVSSSAASTVYAGGVLAYNKGVLNTSYSVCEIDGSGNIGTNYFGGICGINYNDNGKVNDCFFKSNNTELTLGYSYGGFLSSKQYNNCYSYQKMLSENEQTENLLETTFYSKNWLLSTLSWDMGKWHATGNDYPSLYWAD